MTKIYKKSMIAFIDLLGFRSAVEKEENAAKILRILNELKSGEKNGSIDVERRDSETAIKILPTITAFSDCIVISVSEDQFDVSVDINWWSSTFIEFLNHIQQLAAFAIKNDFLIRGGIACDDLYHFDGILFGPGMNKAYNLESNKQSSRMPKILIDAELACKLMTDVRNNKYIQKNTGDEEFYLDYLLIILSRRTEFSVSILPKIINETIRGFSKNEECHDVLKKWEWFREYYEKSLEKIRGSKCFYKASVEELHLSTQ